jgi:putative membrane protein
MQMKESEGFQTDENGMKNQDPRFHLANERTLLAWIRTSIAVMAFGFVVVKFSLFLKQIAYLVGKGIAVPKGGYSSTIGTLIVALGAIILLLSYIKYKQVERRLLADSYRPSSKLAFKLTVTILVMSVLLILYLIENSLSLPN